MTSAKIPAALLTGTVGSGKTVVAAEIGELLGEHGKRVAVVDLDWLGWLTGPDRRMPVEALILENLSAVWPNFLNAGAEYLVMCRALSSSDEIAAIHEAVPGSHVEVVVLTSSLGTIEERLRRRDSGVELQDHLAQAQEFGDAIEALELERHRVVNEDRSIRSVAEELVRVLGWL